MASHSLTRETKGVIYSCCSYKVVFLLVIYEILRSIVYIVLAGVVLFPVIHNIITLTMDALLMLCACIFWRNQSRAVYKPILFVPINATLLYLFRYNKTSLKRGHSNYTPFVSLSLESDYPLNPFQVVVCCILIAPGVYAGAG